jgi:hypothetical protein
MLVPMGHDPWDYDSPVDELDEDIEAAERDVPGTRARIEAGLDRRRLARQLATRRAALALDLENAAARTGFGVDQLEAMEDPDGGVGLDDLAVYAAGLGFRLGWRLERRTTRTTRPV